MPTDAVSKVTTKTIRVAKFVDGISQGLSATQAYIRAGFKASTPGVAGTEGHKLLKKPEVQEALAKIRAKVDESAVLTLEEKRRFLARVVREPIGGLDEHDPLVQEVTREELGGPRGKLKRGDADEGNEEVEPLRLRTKIKMPDKLRAIELDSKLAGELGGDGPSLGSADIVEVLIRLRRPGIPQRNGRELVEREEKVIDA